MQSIKPGHPDINNNSNNNSKFLLHISYFQECFTLKRKTNNEKNNLYLMCGIAGGQKIESAKDSKLDIRYIIKI